MQSIETDKDLIVDIEHLSFSYDGQTEVLADISLSLHRGDYVGLIGPNGGGKSTLIKLVLGLLNPSNGKISLFGKNATQSSGRRRIGYVSQQAATFDSLFPATVAEVVLMGLYAKRGLFRRTTDADRKKVEEVLTDVDMLSHKNTRISDLSGGQRQRVFLAQAIVNEPELIVLDEPTIGIDEESEARFYSLLSYFNKELKMSIILASHDLECIAKEVKQLIVVDKSLRVYNNPQEALIQEHHHFFHHHV